MAQEQEQEFNWDGIMVPVYYRRLGSGLNIHDNRGDKMSNV